MGAAVVLQKQAASPFGPRTPVFEKSGVVFVMLLDPTKEKF